MFPVPRQLPPGPAYLIGREPDIAALDDLLHRQRTHCLVLAISGPGGVGKTALSESWLQGRANDFPDGQLYVDLDGDSDEPVAVRDVLGWFLRALGLPEARIPGELAERTSLYRSMTAGLALSVLLDNAASAAQIRPLLPTSPHSAAVVTSRVRLPGLTLDGAHLLEIAPLNDDDAVTMLAVALGPSRVEAEWASAQELVRLCSGFPIAVAVATAQLIAHPNWSLSEFTVRLRREQDRLSTLSVINDVSLQAIFDSSHAALSDNTARLYRLLSVLPGPDIAEALARGLPPHILTDAGTALNELVDANLLLETVGPRFEYHDLLRVHARRLSERHDAPALRALVELHGIHWYLDRAVEADLVVNPQRWHLGPRYATANHGVFASSAEALDWYEQEWLNLLAVVRSAAERDWHDLVWQWCEAMWSFFLYRKHYSDWFDTHWLGIEAASRDEAALAECRVRCQLAFGFLDLDRFDDAVDVCQPALALAEEEGELESISTCLSQLAKAARGKGDLELALEYLTRALDLVQRIGDRRGIALRLRRLSNVLVDLGRLSEAIEYLKRSIDLLQEIEDWTGYARALTVLGSTCVRAGRFDEAMSALDTALQRMSGVGSPSYLADIRWELATVESHAGNMLTARDHLKAAERLYRESGHPRWKDARERLCHTGFPMADS